MCRYHDIFPLFPFCGCYWFAEQQIIIIWIWVCDFLTSPSSHFKVGFFLFFYSVFLPPGVCVCRYLKVPMGNMGVFDPTEIHNRGQLKSHMKEAMIKLGYHLLCFFIYLYRWEHWNTWEKKFSLKLFFFFVVVFLMSCPALLLQHDPGSDQRLKHTGPLSSPTTPRALCSHKPACRMQSDRRSACCVCCHQFHFMTLMKSGVSGTVYCCNSNKKWSRQKAISQKWAKFLLSSLLLCRAVIF